MAARTCLALVQLFNGETQLGGGLDDGEVTALLEESSDVRAAALAMPPIRGTSHLLLCSDLGNACACASSTGGTHAEGGASELR